MLLAVAAVGVVCVVAAIALMGRVEGDATRASELLVSSVLIPPPLHCPPRSISADSREADQELDCWVCGANDAWLLRCRSLLRWLHSAFGRWGDGRWEFIFGGAGRTGGGSTLGTSAFTEVPRGAPHRI
jgi:hypothetical protein